MTNNDTERFILTTEPDDIDPSKTVHVLIDRDGENGSAFAFETRAEAEQALARIAAHRATSDRCDTLCGIDLVDIPDHFGMEGVRIADDTALISCPACLSEFNQGA